MNDDHALDIMELLTDWFETIEEVELTDMDRERLQEIAQSFTDLSYAALENGFTQDSFEEWLRIDVLEQWSNLMEDVEDLEDEMNLPAECFISSLKISL